MASPVRAAVFATRLEEPVRKGLRALPSSAEIRPRFQIARNAAKHNES